MEVRKPVRRARPILLWSGVGVGVVAAVVAVFVVRNARGNDHEKKKGDKEGPTAAPVELTAVRSGNISTWLEGTTFLEARNSAVLVARRQGQVVSLQAEEGQFVRKGDVLARLDETEPRLAFERAQIASDVASREAERGKQLMGKSLMSQKEMDDIELRERTAHQELEQARYDLSQTRIVAPFSGCILRRTVNLGETLTPGRECYEVADLHPLLARLYFPERDLARVRIGQEALLEFETLPGKKFAGRVSLVNPAVDRTNGTFKVTLEVEDPEGSLRPGAFARVRLLTGSHDRALLLPRRAVLGEDGEDFVFVAHADSVIRVPVVVGAVERDTAEIAKGVAEGDSVVTVGQGGLKHGMKIRAVRS